MNIPPLLVSDDLRKGFGTLPLDVQEGIIGILRYRKCNGLADDSDERVPAAQKYQEFLKTRRLDQPVLKDAI
jgi:hypothetical protein